VQIDPFAAIAGRALEIVGAPFKLGGRCPRAGLDCVGVVGFVLADNIVSHPIPNDYALRGEYLDRISAFFNRPAFQRLENASLRSGDILLYQPSVRQLHLAVVTVHGAVHAHAGLRRVVLTPLPLPWALIGHWRFTGD
jgi:cell wall-associated NlpC family hydrolase